MLEGILLEEGWMNTLSTTENIRSVAVLVLFLVTGFGSKSTWINGQVLFWAAVGIAMIAAPSALIGGLVKGKVSAQHLQLVRFEGACHIWIVFLLVTNRKSKDDRFWMATFITGTVMNAGMLVCGLMAQSQLFKSKPGLTAAHLTFLVLVHALCFLGYLYQVVFFKAKSGSRVEKAPSTRINVHLLIEIVVAVLSVIMGLGYTELFYKEMLVDGAAVDGVQLYMVRYGSVFHLARVVCLLLLLRLDTAHKKTFLKMNLVVDILSSALLVYGFHSGLVNSHFMHTTFPIYFGVLFINRLLAILI